jgi:hypothetical protein
MGDIYTRAGHGGEELSKFTASIRSLQPISLYSRCFPSVLVCTLTLVLLVHPQHTHAEEVAVQWEPTQLFPTVAGLGSGILVKPCSSELIIIIIIIIITPWP